MTRPAGERDFMLPAAETRFERGDDGRVMMVRGERRDVVGSVAGAFPLSRPRRNVSVRDENGDEIGILDSVRELDDASRKVINAELDRAYFMPRITDILDVREELSLVRFEVATNRGPRAFDVRGIRSNLRKLGHGRIIIRDVDGNRYDIRNWLELPAGARRLIEVYV
jgi:hypothetical protein